LERGLQEDGSDSTTATIVVVVVEVMVVVIVVVVVIIVVVDGIEYWSCICPQLVQERPTHYLELMRKG